MVNLSSARRALSRTGNSSTRRAGPAGLGAAGLGLTSYSHGLAVRGFDRDRRSFPTAALVSVSARRRLSHDSSPASDTTRAPIAQMTNAARLVMCPVSQPKFWPKKPVTNVSDRQEDRGQDGELLHGGVLPVADPCLRVQVISTIDDHLGPLKTSAAASRQRSSLPCAG
jgi:hypothetical protein